MNQIKIIAILALSLASLFFRISECISTEGKSKSENTLKVVRVSDGDSLVAIVNGRSEKIRLIGIDAPELGQGPWGGRAKKHLESLAAFSASIFIEYDVDRRDRHGRILAYLRTGDGRLVNEEMLKDGYAVLFTFPPNVRYVDLLTAAQRTAREKKAGIWGKKGLKEMPGDWRKAHPRVN